MTEERKSFWTSAAGIITGIAALITAIAGLYGVLYQTGHVGNNPSGPQVDNERPINRPQTSSDSTTKPQPPSESTTSQNGKQEPQAKFRLVSQGREILKGSFTLDLDTGVIGGAAADADLFWEIVSDDSHYLQTQNSAELSLLGATDLSRISNDTFLNVSYGPARLNGSPTQANQIPSGTVILVKTNGGHYAKVRIEQYGIAAPGDLPQWPKQALLMRWETFALEKS